MKVRFCRGVKKNGSVYGRVGSQISTYYQDSGFEESINKEQSGARSFKKAVLEVSNNILDIIRKVESVKGFRSRFEDPPLFRIRTPLSVSISPHRHKHGFVLKIWSKCGAIEMDIDIMWHSTITLRKGPQEIDGHLSCTVFIWRLQHKQVLFTENCMRLYIYIYKLSSHIVGFLVCVGVCL